MEGEKSEARCNGEDGEREEEEKMEQFFALIRNFREARDRRKDELRQNKARRLNNEQSNWVPCFEWADFTGEIEFRTTPIIFPTLNNNNKDDSGKQQQQQQRDDGLDLKLTL
ncbi:NIM1-interacting 1 [Hibiscus trionum]|uniref:NIM1-interacting 1 n=1 Tax=Hibiscus trionum TaxID=183268 RepID=A0A9W7H2I8_HIBTR|nr:NIM1-interacting 1 [Hibiscus trionum]